MSNSKNILVIILFSITYTFRNTYLKKIKNLEDNLKDYQNIFKNNDCLSNTEFKNIYPDAISHNGGGTKAMTHCWGLYSALFNILEADPVTIFSGMSHIGGNSGGTWWMSILTFFEDLKNMKNMDFEELLTLYDTKWWDPIREELFSRDLNYYGSKINKNGLAIKSDEPDYLESKIRELVDNFLNNKLSISDLYNIFIVKMFGISDIISEKIFSEVIEKIGIPSWVENIFNFIRYLKTFTGFATNNSWNCGVIDFFLYPIKGNEEITFNDLRYNSIFSEISKKNNKPFTVTMVGCVVWESYLRYGLPGKANGLKLRYPSYSDPFQYIDQDIVRYRWENSLNDGKTMGGVYNQCFTYYPDEDNEPEDGPDFISVYNFDENQTNQIHYAKGPGHNVYKKNTISPVKCNSGNTGRNTCKYKPLILASTLSSAAPGVVNNKQTLIDEACKFVKGFFSKMNCDDSEIYKTTGIGLMITKSKITGDITTEIIKKILVSTTLGFGARLITSNKTLVMDNNNCQSEFDLGGFSGKYFTGKLSSEEENECKSVGIFERNERYQWCAGAPTIGFEEGWNGIVSPSVFTNWEKKGNDQRCIFQACDGGGVDNTGIVVVLKSMLRDWEDGTTKEIYYVPDFNISVLNGSIMGLGSGLLPMFGLPGKNEEYYEDDIYYRSLNNFNPNTVGSIPAFIPTPSSWVFGIGDKNTPKKDRQNYLEDKIGENIWPKENMYTSFDNVLTDEQWNKLAKNKNIEKDIGQNASKKDIIEKLKTYGTGVRIVRIENVDLRENLGMGVVNPGKRKVNITVFCSYSKLQMAPIPEYNKRIFSKEFYSAASLTLQWMSLNNKEGNTKDCLKKLFPNVKK